jgi:hypothetical protein
MGLITRILPPDAKNAKLTFQDMDNNLYYLQSLGVSGLTYSANTLTITNPTGGTKSVNIASDTNTFITAFTYNNNIFTIKQNNGQSDLTSTISVVTGLTVNGSLIANTISATTFLNVPSFVNMSLGHSSLNPADATTYYIGGLQSLSPSTTNRDSWSMVSQYNGSITEVSILSSFGGGSSENSTVSIENLSANTSQSVTTTLKYVTGTPVQILFQPFSAATQPSGWTSFLVAFTTYAGLTGTTSTLTSPLFDGSQYNTINVVTEVAKFGAGTDGPILVEYSLNSGSTWSNAGTTATPTGSTPYVTSTVVVPTTSSQMLIRFSVNPSGTSGKRLRNVFFNGVSSSLNDNYILSSPLLVSSGDKIQIRWVTPVWSTNPTNVTNLYNLKIRL